MIGTGSRDFASHFHDLSPQISGVGDHPLGDEPQQVLRDLFLDCLAVFGVPVDVKAGLHRPPPERVVWPCPALSVVPFVPQRIEVAPLTWRGYVQGFSRAQVNAGDQDVDMHTAIFLAVQDGGQVYVLPVQSGKSQLLEVVQHGVDFILCRCLFGSPRDNGAGIPLLERQRVGQGTEQHRVSPQHLNACPSNPLVV
ncbi:hypothetical protein [Aeromonas veronii]|jgi:hypothetical protein